MISMSLRQSGVHNFRIVLIPDIHDPVHWVDHVLTIVSDFDVVLTTNPLTKELFSEKGFTVKSTPVYQRGTFSGKEIRQRIQMKKPWEELVPKPVAIFIKKINGVERIQRLRS
jgi:nicotinamide-nucleotide adenylyltransferase